MTNDTTMPAAAKMSDNELTEILLDALDALGLVTDESAGDGAAQ